jgi:aconitate hydratase
VAGGAKEIPFTINGKRMTALLDLTPRERQELLAGGTLNFVKQGGEE